MNSGGVQCSQLKSVGPGAARTAPDRGTTGVSPVMQSESTPSPRAIETTYRGFRFRSRLEARWAVFLDALNVYWEYEPEGFRLSNGLYYLPDFSLRLIPAWLEVKGEFALDDDDEIWLKARGLALDSGRRVYVFFREFSDLRQPIGWEISPTDSGADVTHQFRVYWFLCPSCHVWQPGATVADLPCNCMRRHRTLWQPGLEEASERARGARFEFGERG